MPNPTWKTLLEVYDRLEAEIVKNALEAQGIPCEIFQEGAVHFGFAVTVGPMSKVQICVPDTSFDKALAWLDEYQSGKLQDEDTQEE